MSENTTQTYYTLTEAAEYKGVSYHTVSRAIRRKKLAARNIGRMYLIEREALDAWRPMVERAPRIYRKRTPNLNVTPTFIGDMPQD